MAPSRCGCRSPRRRTTATPGALMTSQRPNTGSGDARSATARTTARSSREAADVAGPMRVTPRSYRRSEVKAGEQRALTMRVVDNKLALETTGSVDPAGRRAGSSGGRGL